MPASTPGTQCPALLNWHWFPLGFSLRWQGIPRLSGSRQRVFGAHWWNKIAFCNCPASSTGSSARGRSSHPPPSLYERCPPISAECHSEQWHSDQELPRSPRPSATNAINCNALQTARPSPPTEALTGSRQDRSGRPPATSLEGRTAGGRRRKTSCRREARNDVLRGPELRSKRGPAISCRLETSRYRAYPAPMPAAAPLTPAARRFAIKLPRPRGIGVAE